MKVENTKKVFVVGAGTMGKATELMLRVGKKLILVLGNLTQSGKAFFG